MMMMGRRMEQVQHSFGHLQHHPLLRVYCLSDDGIEVMMLMGMLLLLLLLLLLRRQEAMECSIQTRCRSLISMPFSCSPVTVVRRRLKPAHPAGE